MPVRDQLPLRIQLLGPVRIWRDGQQLPPMPPLHQAVLAVLAMRTGKIVSRHELIDAVWDSPSEKVISSLHTYIAWLRKALEPGRGHRAPGQVLVTSGSGYLLRLSRDQVDAAAFADHLAAARRASADGEQAAAAAALEAALGCWQGTALAGVGGLWAENERFRLAEARLAAVEQHAEVKLGQGGHAELAAELSALVHEHPLREGLRSQLMLALYRCGRQAEALAVYRDARRLLAADQGIEPGPRLRRLHEQVLAGDPALDLAPAAARAAARAPVPRELPADVDAFTGRTAELAGLDRLLAGTGQDAPQPDRRTAVMVSVVSGTAGVGKTALAVHWAHRVPAAFPDGQLYVNLRGYDPDQPVPAGEALARFLRALGLTGQDIPLETEERAARYRSLVHGKRMLIMLDNAATVEQVRPLLPGAGSVAVLVTSRDSLAGLVARDGAHRLDLDMLPAGNAVALLGRLVGGRVSADPAAAAMLASACARLPLAIRVAAELAAARPAAPLAELAAELAGRQHGLDLLDAGGDPRSAIRSVFSWSCQHLTPAAARAFRLLGLHPGPDWDGYGAAALTGADAGQAARLLGSLERAHLIQPAGQGRYDMHDLLRSYAAGLAAGQDGEAGCRAALSRLFDYYLASAAAAIDTLLPAEQHRRPLLPPAASPIPAMTGQAAAVAWLDAERASLVAVAAHTASHGWPGHAIRLAGILSRYLLGGHYTDAVAIHTHALLAARQCDDRPAQAHTLTSLGTVYRRQGRYQQAADLHQQALTLAREVGDRLAEARALGNLGNVCLRQGRHQQASDCAQQALALFRSLGDEIGEAIALDNLGSVYLRQGRHQQAAGNHRQALALYRKVRDRSGEANALTNLGDVSHQQGHYQQAAGHHQRALELYREMGDREGEAHTLAGLGVLLGRQGRYQQAVGHLEQALDLYQAMGDHAGEASALNGAGEALLATGQPGQARARHAAALALAREIGNPQEQARALTGLGAVLHRQHGYQQAAGHHQRALDLYREIGDRAGEASALNGAGEALLAAGQPGEARARHAEALALARQAGDLYQQARADDGLARACRASGEPGQAVSVG